MTTNTAPKSARDMTDAEYKVARAQAASGKLPVAAAALPPADTQPPAEPPQTSTSSTNTPPPANALNDRRGVMDLSDSAYRAARSAIIRAADGRAPSTTHPLGFSR